jgi:hypothetical protein
MLFAGAIRDVEDGGCEVEIFTGPDARRQALRYAMRKYGHFEEVHVEPAAPRT